MTIIELEDDEKAYLVTEINLALRTIDENSHNGKALNAVFFKLVGRSHEKHELKPNA